MFLLTFMCWSFSSSPCCRLFLLAGSKFIQAFLAFLVSWKAFWSSFQQSGWLSHSLMWLARFIPFPDGEHCNQTSHSIWTFSICCPNKDSIFAFRSSFILIWETSRLSVHFFSGEYLCFISHFNSLCSHASPYFKCSLLWFIRPAPLFAPCHFNKAK